MSFFLRHFAGFFIQVIGGLTLCLIPFTAEQFRYPRKWVYAGYSALSVLFSIGFPLVMSIPAFSDAMYRSMIANLYMFAVLALYIALYFWVIRTECIKKFLVLILMLFYAATQYLVVNLVTPLFPGGVLPDVYPPLTLAAYAVTTAVFLPFMALLMGRAVKEYMAEIESQNIRREFGMALLATMLYFILLVIYASRPDGMMADFWWWIIPPLLLSTLLLILFYWNLFRESVRRKRDSEMRKALEIQQLQYESITRDVELTRLLRHDMRHHLNHLANLLNENRAAEMQAYLETLTGQVEHRETATYCKNSTINALLQYYTGLASMKDIRCEVTASCGEIPVTPADLTVLIGNTMENAIRSCEKLGDKRWITVHIAVIGNSLMIQTENACGGVYHSRKYREGDDFLTASAFVSDRDGGGHGLTSLEHTAGKYNGSASFRFDDNTKTFTTRIRVDLHPDKRK